MKILGVESSTQQASVALSVNNVVLQQEVHLRQKSHSEFINVAIEKILNDHNLKISDMDGFALSQGPGSFTGIRVAANVVKTLGYYYHKKLMTTDSLYLLALDVPATEMPILTIINAYKNLVYTSLFKRTNGVLQRVIEPRVCTLQDLENLITEPTLVVGDGYKVYELLLSVSLKKNLKRDSSLSDYPQASVLLKNINLTQTLEWNLWTPLYLRASEAEENLYRKMEI